ncbi:MAG TPA: hypothetical protein PKY30_22840, partial [Myxococcota bacterium]|nr:hypothetical protein [Myxococcota bacterium]
MNLAEAYDPAPTLALVQHCQTRPPPPQDAAWMEAELRSLVHSHAEVLGGQLPLSDQSWPRLDLILSAVQAWQHCSAPLGSPSGAASLYFAAGRVAYWRGASDQALVYFRLARSRATEPFAQQVSIWALDAAAKAAGYTNADHMPDGPVDLAPAQQELLAEVETFLGLYPEDPEAPQAHFVGILTLSNHGQWDRSFAAIQRLVLAWPHSLQAVQALELLSRINTRPQALEVVQARVAWALEFTRQYLPEQSAVWAEDQHLVEYQILERDAAAAYQANNYALSISLRERLLAHGAPPEAMALHRARLGEELLRVGRLSEALPHLEQAGQPEALLLAARIVVATGDLAAAQRLDARLDGATAGRMWLELLRGRPDEARLRGLLKSSDRSVALCAQ